MTACRSCLSWAGVAWIPIPPLPPWELLQRGQQQNPSLDHAAGQQVLPWVGSGQPSSMCIIIVWVSCGCCNKLALIQWPKTTQIYHLRILEVGNPKSSHRAKVKVLSLAENPFLCLFCFLKAADNSGHMAPRQQSHHSDLCVPCHIFVWLFCLPLLLTKILVTAPGPLDNPG